jgi:hypothetical protein
MHILILLLLFSIVCVVLSLIGGLISFARADGRQRDYSTLFMGLRVISQGIAVMLIGLLLFFSR